MSERMPTYGGQAVIEGVMMRGVNSVAVAMRAPDDQIVLHTEPLSSIYRSRYTKIPFARGVVALWDALSLGMRVLTISANTQTGDDQKLEGPQLYLTLGFSLLVGIGIFFLLPAAVGGWIQKALIQTSGFASSAAWWSNLAEGILRLALLVGYIWAVGFLPDIRRVFAYHGAEHKTINAFEAGADLTPKNVSLFSLEHPRCGTAFLLTLVIFSVLFFSLLGPLPAGWRLASRILLLPVIAGVAYEYIRWTARHLGSPFVRWMIKPNLALQRLTTREPDLKMLEVSIAAFNAMRSKEFPPDTQAQQITF
jgi:uncharacterized protein YqhQ